jgi:hypothetical protein
MKEIDRRAIPMGMICGATVATVGLAAIPRAAQSMPLGAIKAGAAKPEDLVEEARVPIDVFI